MLRALRTLAALAIALGFSAAAEAAPLAFTGTLEVEFLPGSGLPTVSTSGNGVAEVGADGSFTLPGGAFAFGGTPVGIDLLPDTLAPGTEQVSVDGTAAAGFFGPDAGPGGFGGVMPILGDFRYELLNLSPGVPAISVPLPASLVGGVGGATLTLPVTPGSILSLFVPAGGWQTAQRNFVPALGLLSALSTFTTIPSTFPTTLPSIPVISTAGFDARTPGGLGTIQLVAPVAVQSLLLAPEGIGVLLGRLTLEFSEVPEPSALVLLAGAGAALALGIRARRRAAR